MRQRQQIAELLERLQKDVEQIMRHGATMPEELDELAGKMEAMQERSEGIDRVIAGSFGKLLATDYKLGNTSPHM